MRIRARKIIVFAVAAALSVANGFAPRHAEAGQHAAMTSAAAKPPHHETRQTPHHHAAGHHHGDATIETMAVQALCHGTDQSNPQPNSPIHNCCVASCSAVAFIFASFQFDSPLPKADYGVSPPDLLTPATLVSLDPPPR